METYGIELEQLSPHGQASAAAAERTGARTVITRDNVPVAAFIPASEMDKLEAVGEGKSDPLVELCGHFDNDAFVDGMSALNQTGLYLSEQKGPPSTKRYGGSPNAQVMQPLPLPEVPPRTGHTLRPPPMVVQPPATVPLPSGQPHMAKPPPKRRK